MLLQNSSPDVRTERGGGKTNISLQESSEESGLGSKTSTRGNRTLKFGERKIGGWCTKKKFQLEYVSHWSAVQI